MIGGMFILFLVLLLLTCPLRSLWVLLRCSIC